MLGFFERQRLVRKGLASSKTRRRRTESELVETLEHGLGVKFSIFLAFFLGLSVLIYSDFRAQPTQKVFIAALIFLTALAQLWINHPHTFAKNSRLLLIFGTCLLHLAVVKMILVAPQSQVGAGLLSAAERQQLWNLTIPYAFAPLMLSVLLGKNHGVFAAIFVSLWGAIMYRDINAVFLVMSLISGFIAVFVTLQVRRRSRLIRAGVFVGLATWMLALIFGLIGPIVWESLGSTNWKMIGYQSLVAIGSGFVTAFVVGGILPLVESLFRITTDISWLELADLNHPLLKRMTIEAPGTYHHSLVVANLSEAAAEAIGANAVRCRVCSYFHDIGKLVKPDYFTENMRRDRNPHDDLAPTMSALIIIAHVKEGVDLALKHGLNQEIMDVIQEHHGTSTVFYFYKRALQQQEDARAGGKIMNIREEDIPEVSEESFRYPGPRPQSRECAIISLADCIESASRSLERVTPHKIDQLITDLVERRVLDGQLKECDLTMRELEAIGESFRHTLQSMMHSRVSYPGERTEKIEKTERRETPAPSRSGMVPPVSAA
ncbi:MAG: cyclic-di-AMP phosphodiesterase PgpH [Chthoniobacter sp.]|jgi:putative nucleotidyltransferase with HDIG domain|nr:cyclic-di-AMP phosphodiesterase PgpH [Chthoniobacter sp.]